VRIPEQLIQNANLFLQRPPAAFVSLGGSDPRGVLLDTLDHLVSNASEVNLAARSTQHRLAKKVSEESGEGKSQKLCCGKMVSLPHSPPTTTSRLQETRRYTPYSFDPPPLINLDAADLKLSVDQFQESELIKSEMATTSNADSVLLLAALETLGDSDQGGSDQGGSSRGGQGDMSLSPRSSNSRTTPPSAATDSSSGQSYTGEGDKPGSSSSYGYVSY